MIGDIVTIIDMEWPENDAFGLDLVVERTSGRYRIEARSINVLPPFPDGLPYLVAYLDWKRKL